MTEKDLLAELNKYHTEIIVNRVIEFLIDYKENVDGEEGKDEHYEEDEEDFLTNELNLCLKNFWEKICGQVQTELSINWQKYEDVITFIVKVELDAVKKPVKDLICYMGGFTSIEYIYSKTHKVEFMNGVTEIYRAVMKEAHTFKNDHIISFLKRTPVDDEDDIL